MSTSYYGLKYPFTHITLEERDGTILTWINKEFCGCFVVKPEHIRDALLVFFDTDTPIMRRYWGGRHEGVKVDEYMSALADSYVILSEYGELTTVGVIRATRGVK